MPHRWIPGLVLVLLTAVAVAQPPGPADDLTYRDNSPDGKLIDVRTETRESIAGIQLIIAGKAKAVISPANVVRYDYGSVPGADGSALAVARSLERGGDYVKAHAVYDDLLKKLPANAPEKSRRHLSFREAMTATRLVDARTGEEFAAAARPVIDRLTAVFRSAKSNWEAWPAARTAARLHVELGQFDKAAVLHGELAAIPELPADLKFQARLDEAAALLRAGQSLPAEAILQELEKQKEPAAGPLRDRLAILRTAVGSAASKDAAAQLEAAIAAVKDPGARALGYNFLGDIQAAGGQHRDAMWSYLWVDTVYNQDREEQLLALHRLAVVFEQMGEKDRAEQFREKLIRVRRVE